MKIKALKDKWSGELWVSQVCQKEKKKQNKKKNKVESDRSNGRANGQDVGSDTGEEQRVWWKEPEEKEEAWLL